MVPLPIESAEVSQLGDRGTLQPDRSTPGSNRTACLELYSDGSGGRWSSDRRIRRCGWAWSQIDPNDTKVVRFARWSLLIGSRQTVPTAELAAVTDLFQIVPTTTPLLNWCDNKYVQRSPHTPEFHQVRQDACDCLHAGQSCEACAWPTWRNVEMYSGYFVCKR